MIASARSKALRNAALALVAALGLSGCSMYDGYYGGGVGYASGYNDPYYGGYGYAGAPYYGWYDNFYYPGTGYYVYDRRGRRHAWSDRHRRYWEARRHDHHTANRPGRAPWRPEGYRANRPDRPNHPNGDRAGRQRPGRGDAGNPNWGQGRTPPPTVRQAPPRQPRATAPTPQPRGERGNGPAWKRSRD